MVTSVNSATTAATTSSTSSTSTDAITARVESVLQSQKAGVTKLNSALTADQTKLSGLGQLQSALATFQSVAKALSGAGLATAATPTPAGMLTATTTSSAASGTYAVVVQQLAQGQVLNAASQVSASTALGSGAATTITIDYGTAADGSFTAGSAASKSITIDSGNNTLDGIAAALKTAGVNATVVKSADGYALSLTGPDGSASSMRINVSGDATLGKLLAYDPAGTKNMTENTAAQDALLTVDGKQVTSASNTVSDALKGVTLNLTGKGTSSLVVAQDAGQIATNVATFVTAYNTLNATLQTLGKGALKSDTALNQVTNQLAQILKTGGGSPAALAKAGVTMDTSGNLKLDSTKLKAAIAADPASMSKLFTNDGKGVADMMSTQIATLTGTGGRIVKEVAATTTDLNKVTAQKTALATALTAQATALAALYSQESSALGMFSSSSSSTPSSLFDLMA